MHLVGEDLVIEERVVTKGFHQRVYETVSQVPIGRVTTYGDVATVLGSPRVARHVGWALAALVDETNTVPWQRVINAQGRISFKGQTVRAELQRRLLEQEGIVFDSKGRVELKRLRWRFDPGVIDKGAVGEDQAKL